MNVLSLFDGISCGRVALERAGIKVDKYYASEIDKYAISVAQKNYPDTIQVGSVVDLKGEDFEDIDLMMGGFPCQDLSIAKKNREGLKGERSGLFYELIRLHKEIKPKWFIYENVASMSKENKEIITDTLKELDPNTYCIMINGALVSAQNRKRLFWTNIPNVEQPEDKGILLKDILEDEVDDKYYIKPKNIKSQTDRFIQWDTSGKGYNSQQDRTYSEKGKSPTVPSNGASNKMNVILNGGGRGAKTVLYQIINNKVRVRKHDVDIESLKKILREHKNLTNNQIAKKLNKPLTLVEHWFRGDKSFAIPSEDIWLELKKLLNIKTNDFDKSIMEWEEKDGVFDQSKRVYIGDKTPTLQTGQQGLYATKIGNSKKFGNPKKDGDKSYTLTSGRLSVGVEQDYKIRKLTPIECERLTTLPDNYTAKGIGDVEISNTQRYKMCGNAFIPDVVAHILKNIKQ